MVTPTSSSEMATALERLHQRGQLPKQWKRDRSGRRRSLTWYQTVHWYFPDWSRPYYRTVRSRWEKYLAMHPQTRVLWFCWRARTRSEGAKKREDYDAIRRMSAVIHPRLVAERPHDWIILTDCVVDAFLDAYPPGENNPTPRMTRLLASWESLVLSIDNFLLPGDSISRGPMPGGVCVCVSQVEEFPEVAHAWWSRSMDRRTTSHERVMPYTHAPHWVREEEKEAWEERMNP